jgi:hypothetical protein
MSSTVNDVMLAAVSGALHRYMVQAGEWVDPRLSIRAMVPVSIRRPHEMDQINNRFGLVLLSLPVGIEDPLERLLVLKRRMDAIKGTPEAAVAFGILSIMGMTPIQIERLVLDFFAAKSTAVMTNVRGPGEVLYYAGARMRQMVFWVPTPGHLGLGLSIYSYAGEVSVGFATDACLVPDPEKLVDGLEAELAEMERWTSPVSGGERVATTVVPDGNEHSAAAQLAGELDEMLKSSVVQTLRRQHAYTQAHPAKTVAPASAMAQGGNGDHNGLPQSTVSVAGEAPTTAGVPVASEMRRCTALTVSGEPCRNRALHGFSTCRVHTSGLSQDISSEAI